MLRLKRAVLALLIFSLIVPNFVNAFTIKPLITAVDSGVSVEKVDPILDKDLLIQDDDPKIEIDLPEGLDKLDILSPEEIIDSSKDNTQAFLASSWDQDFLLDQKTEATATIGNNLSMDLFRGAAKYTYPLDLPAGRNGMGPNIALAYNHQLENHNDYMPFGWSLAGFMYIERNNANGVDSIYQDNEFIFSNGGRLKPYSLTDQIHGEYRLALDDGQALRFFFRTDNSWDILDKNGVRYYLGKDFEARDYSGALTYKWNISLVEDLQSNNISYYYDYLEGVSYPKSITYTNWANEPGIYRIDFEYNDRAKDYKVYKAGFEQNYKKQLNGISVYVEDKIIRYYQLAVSDNDSPLLWEILEWYFDDNANPIIEKSRTSFDYEQKEENNWQAHSWGNVDFSFLYPGDVQLLDVNNDGLSDLMRSADILYNNGNVVEEREAWRNGSAQSLIPMPAGDWESPAAYYNYYESAYSFFTDSKYIDINGDSYLDFVHDGQVYIANYNHDYDLANYNLNSNYTWWPHWYYLNNLAVERGSLADLNADGLQDYIFTKTQGSYLSKWGENQNNILANWLVMPEAIIDANNKARGVRLIDLNKDGLADFLRSFKDELNGTEYKYAYINKGNGDWEAAPAGEYEASLFFNTRKSDGTIVDNKVFLLDINNDGYLDFVDPFSSNVYLFNEKSWMREASSYYELPEQLYNGFNWEDFRWGEANGEPGIDLWFLQETSTLDELVVYENQSSYHNLLTEISNDEGATIKLEYTNSSWGEDNHGPSRALLKTVELDDGFGQKQLEEYSYEGGEYFIDNIWDKGFNGFSKITRRAFNGHEEEYYFHQGNGINNSYEGHDDASLRGKLYLRRNLDENNNLLEEYYYNWQHQQNSLFNLVNLKDETQGFLADSNSAYKSTHYDYDIYGNLVDLIQKGEVNFSSENREIIDLDQSDNIYLNYYYANHPRAEILNVLKEIKISDYQNNVLKDQKYYYDNLDFGAVVKGLVTREEILKDDNEWISKNNEYNKYGLIIQNSDFKGNKTVYEYDKYNLYLSKIINPLGFEQKFENNYACSLLSKEIDPNNLAFVREYDEQCRLKSFYKENLNTGELEKIQDLEYEKTFPSKQIDFRYLDDSGRFQKVISYYDGFKRKILQLVSLPNGNWQAVLYRYDLDGNLTFKSDYFEAYTDAWFPYSPLLYTEFKYDSLNRLVEFKDPHYWVLINYGLLEKEMIINGRPRKFKFDIEGNPIEVSVRKGTVFETSFYEYDLLGHLSKYIDVHGNERNWDYDNLDNLLYNEDIHAPGDDSFISWNYEWDANSNLKKKTIVSAGISINYQYDKLNRLISEDDSSSPYLDYNYLYDLGRNALGKMTGVKTANFEKSFEYDDFANLASENFLIKGKNYSYFYKYDYLGNPLQAVYPDKSVINYEYNINGQLYRSSLVNAEGEKQDIVLNRRYNIWGALESESLGNGTSVSYSFNDRKNITQEKITDRNDRVLWQQDYEVDWDDNLESMVISSSYFSDIYQYETSHDEWDRLTRAELYKNGNLEKLDDYDYDSVNNMLSSSDYDFYYDKKNAAFNNPYAPTGQIAKNPRGQSYLFKYDKQGNVISDGLNEYTWNGLNHLVSKNSAEGKINYLYDESGQRIYREEKDAWTIYAGALNENSEGDLNIYYNNYQEKKSDKNGVEKYFNYYDKFSNLILQLDENSELENYYIYKPFGEIYLAANSNRGSPYLFHRQESDGDLDYVQGRYYDRSSMHWLSLDPAFENFPVLEGADLNHLMSHPYLINPYSYLANSPWRYVDSEGEFLGTIIDLISIGISFYDFLMDPSFSTGLLFMYDVGAALVPFLPASKTAKMANLLKLKAVQGGQKMTHVLKETATFLGKSLKDTMKMVKTVASELSSSSWVKKLAKWSAGRVGDRLMNFAIHFVKHIGEFIKYDIKNVDDYFNFASKFLDASGDKLLTDLGYFYKFMDGASEAFYNPYKKIVIIIDKIGDSKVITTMYEVTDNVKHSRFWNSIKDLMGLFWQSLLAKFWKFSF